MVVAAAFGALVGACVAAQGRFNGDLAESGAGVLVASWLSYVGTLATVVLAVAARRRVVATARILRRQGSWWWYAIGLCGVPIVLAMAAGIPLVGVAVASVASVAGQTVAGLTLDARGVGLPAPLRLTARRLGAGLAAMGGLAVAVLVGSGPSADVATVVAVGVALFVAGGVLAGQQAGNGRVTALSGDPLVAGFASVVGGTVGVSVLIAGAVALGRLGPVTLPGADHWYLYLGGPLGAAITVVSAWAVRHLGTFALTLAIVGGQMVTAIVLDVAVGLGVHWSTLVAVVLIAASTVLAVGRPRTRVAAAPSG